MKNCSTEKGVGGGKFLPYKHQKTYLRALDKDWSVLEHTVEREGG